MTEYDVTEAMLKYGGSFVQQLARLIRLADADNKRRLVDAFPEYLAEYRVLAARTAASEARSLLKLDPEALLASHDRIARQQNEDGQ